MAKAKKSAGSSKKKSGPSPSGSLPALDANLAAEVAARMLLARKQTAPPTARSQESSTFKQMKQSLDKSHLRNVNTALGGPSAKGGRRSGHSFGPQTSRNQTFGADVSRAGLPRRTGG